MQHTAEWTRASRAESQRLNECALSLRVAVEQFKTDEPQADGERGEDAVESEPQGHVSSGR
jgi:hypothetical protein